MMSESLLGSVRIQSITGIDFTIHESVAARLPIPTYPGGMTKEERAERIKQFTALLWAEYELIEGPIDKARKETKRKKKK